MSDLNLKEFRLKNGYSQSDIAEILGVTQPHYHKLEVGKSLANSNQILKLCDVFKCTPNDLFGIKGSYVVAMDQLDD
jgi:DNA-binding XRE family transcriptional regulator